jgi:sRNA-binding regulator protein Hfq
MSRPAGADDPIPPAPGESETLLAGARASAVSRVLDAPEPPRRGPLLERIVESRSHPFLRVVLYYAVLTTVMALLAYHVPMVRSAFLSPVSLSLEEGGTLAGPVGDYGGKLTLEEALERALVTLLVIAGALVLVIPVAWVYMLTKRFRYDPALVSSVIILPIVVAGIALVVKNSIALAFALAGIVAAVRFRNTLKDPRDAVYIFLVIGIGLSAGVQALDVALVMSFAFNLVVLLVWRHNVGTIYSGRYARTGILSVGSARLLLAQHPDAQRVMRRRMLDEAADLPTDGILLVHSRLPALARNTVQEALADLARDWRLVDVVDREEEGLVTLEYLVKLKREAAPADLVGALDERWGAQVAAAEYVPFRTRRRKRKKKR